MAISDRLTKLTTDITNAYTSINNKGGTIPANKNTNNLSTAIDSIEVIESATAEGESLSLTNTKAMPYSDYVVKGKNEQDGEPSPSIPSEIHSVADDVNLFDIGEKSNYKSVGDNSAPNWLTVENNKLTIIIQPDGATMFYNSKQYSGNKTYTLKIKTSMAQGRFYVKLRNEDNSGWLSNSDVSISNMTYNSYYNGWFSQSSTSDFTLTVNIPTCLYCCFGFGFGSSNVGTTQTIENIKLQKGTVTTPYSPYNQGTVTIKQRGKNKFDYKQITPNASRTIENGGFVINNTDFQHGSSVGILKNLCPDLKVGDKFKFNWDTNATRNNTDVTYIYLSSYADTVRKDITYTCTQEMLDSETYFYGQQGEYYKDIIFYLDRQTSDYEPYQGNDYTFQTEPLRSLPNGVKDTIEAEQHRKIGKQTGTLTETTTITLSDAKTNGAYMCNIKPSGTLTGKTIELEAGDYEIIYELEEEIIEPLTQNQATTMLDIIKTGSYEGTTNINTDEDVKPTIKADYYKKK